MVEAIYVVHLMIPTFLTPESIVVVSQNNNNNNNTTIGNDHITTIHRGISMPLRHRSAVYMLDGITLVYVDLDGSISRPPSRRYGKSVFGVHGALPTSVATKRC